MESGLATEKFVQEITGGWVSCMRMVWFPEVVLPLQSVATQVRMMVEAPVQLPAITESEYETVTSPAQLSVAVACPVADGRVLAVHSIVTAGGMVKTGLTLSTIVMVCCFVTEFPFTSVNVQLLTKEEVPGHDPKIRSPSV
jgi:hypothetical protein